MDLSSFHSTLFLIALLLIFELNAYLFNLISCRIIVAILTVVERIADTLVAWYVKHSFLLFFFFSRQGICVVFASFIISPVLKILWSETFARLPMYGELKLALFIYLWYPKTKVRN